jgi:hypothetical protein
MPLQATSGAASYDAFGGGVAAVPNYIEDVFSTYLYTGNVTARSITNGIDLAGKGGLVWVKSRAAASHYLQDTARGVTYTLSSDSTAAQAGPFTGTVTSANADGFSLGTSGLLNGNSVNYASWTFREQPKFFDVVTYTGNNSAQTLSHNLGSVPGCMIVKSTTNATNWAVYHRSLGNAQWIKLNSTDASVAASASFWNLTDPTSTNFTVGTALSNTGQTFVAYLFAHDAGGFGLTGTDNVISCGSFTTNASGNATVSLGYEPQWVMIKRTDSATNGAWFIFDTMRGFSLTSNSFLQANAASAETTFANTDTFPTSTGFVTGPNITNASASWIYIAIRRGPMKVPTSGTQVYAAVARQGTSAAATITAGFPYDWLIAGIRTPAYGSKNWDRLRGITNPLLNTVTTAAEYTGSANSITAGTQLGLTVGADTDSTINDSAASYIDWFFRRNPSVFDIVCYTGTGVATTFTHNLGVVPELMIVKSRSAGQNWRVYSAATTATSSLVLNTTAASAASSAIWNDTAPTSSVFSLGTNTNVNGAASTYVNYLFATCAGVSKVGSYTGTGALQTVNCGFTTGARWVMIKRTDSTGDWYVYDTTRGMTSGNDPYYLLNSNNAEVTNTNYVDTDSTGFKVTAAAPAGLNASGGTYIFLAIA